MSIASLPVLHKVGSVVTLAQQLERYVREAAQQAKPLDEVERTIWDRVLQIGHASV